MNLQFLGSVSLRREIFARKILSAILQSVAEHDYIRRMKVYLLPLLDFVITEDRHKSLSVRVSTHRAAKYSDEVCIVTGIKYPGRDRNTSLFSR